MQYLAWIFSNIIRFKSLIISPKNVKIFCPTVSTVLQKVRTLNICFCTCSFFKPENNWLSLATRLIYPTSVFEVGWKSWKICLQMLQSPMTTIWNVFVTPCLKYSECAIFKEDHEKQTDKKSPSHDKIRPPNFE